MQEAIPVGVEGVGSGGGVGLSPRVYLYFAGLLVLYGGLETCLSGWLTTYALRYGGRTLVLSEYTTLLFWMSLTFGRVGSSLVMLKVGERSVQRWSLLVVGVFTAGAGGGAFGLDDWRVCGFAGAEHGSVFFRLRLR